MAIVNLENSMHLQGNRYWLNITTVKSVYSGHLWEFDKITTIYRWPLYEGVWLFDEIFYSSCK
jgi:hypothetical protein